MSTMKIIVGFICFLEYSYKAKKNWKVKNLFIIV